MLLKVNQWLPVLTLCFLGGTITGLGQPSYAQDDQVEERPELSDMELIERVAFLPVSYTHLTLPTIYSV